MKQSVSNTVPVFYNAVRSNEEHFETNLSESYFARIRSEFQTSVAFCSRTTVVAWLFAGENVEFWALHHVSSEVTCDINKTRQIRAFKLFLFVKLCENWVHCRSKQPDVPWVWIGSLWLYCPGENLCCAQWRSGAFPGLSSLMVQNEFWLKSAANARRGGFPLKSCGSTQAGIRISENAEWHSQALMSRCLVLGLASSSSSSSTPAPVSFTSICLDLITHNP